MKSALKQALADCLARLEAGAGIEECLRGHDALAAELRPLLEAGQGPRAPGGAGHPAWAGLWRPLALTGAAAAVVVLAALGLTTDVFRFGADTTSAQVDGVVSRVDPDA